MIESYFNYIKEGNLEKFLSIIEKIGTELLDDWGNSALQQAAYYNQKDLLNLLLGHGATLDPKSLTTACSMGYTEVAILLIHNKVDVNYQDAHGMSPLMWAARKNATLVCTLLDAGANVILKDKNGTTAMMHACNAEIVEILIKQGLDLEEKNKYDQSAINLAASYGETKAIEGYLAHGAVLNSLDQYHNTPLINASIGGYEEAVKLLLSKKADTSIKNKYDRTALGEALLRKNKFIQNVLIKATDIDLFDAVHIGKLSLIKKLSKVESLSTKNSDNNTLLMTAAYWQHLNIVKYLVAEQQDVNATNKHGWSALKFTCFQPSTKSVKIIEYLLAQGAHIDACSSDGESILMYSASYVKSNKISECLIDLGANIEQKDKWGNTALVIACKAGNIKLVKLLIEKGANAKVTLNGKVLKEIIEEALELAKGSWEQTLTRNLNKVLKLINEL
jgi:ankyrin repeat protein